MRLFITVGQIAFLPCAAQRGFGVKAFVSIAGEPFVFLLCFAFCRTWRQMLSPALSMLHANKHTQHHKACNPIYKETLDNLCVFVGSTKLCWSIVDSVKGDLVSDEVHLERVFTQTLCKTSAFKYHVTWYIVRHDVFLSPMYTSREPKIDGLS